MKEHPIIFSTDMIKAILNGSKTQSRRVIKPQPYFDDGLYDQGWIWEGLHHQEEADLKQLILLSGKCPYGGIFDRLWCKETFGFDEDDQPIIFYKVETPDWGGKWRPSIFMPRWASRIVRDIILLRVERLLEISKADAKAEGFNSIGEFLIYWDTLNKKRGYGVDVNPWNWVIGW